MFEVYVKDGCAYCKRAEYLLMEDDQEFIIINVTNSEQFKALVTRREGWYTYPIIKYYSTVGTSHKGILVGGSSDLSNFLMNLM